MSLMQSIDKLNEFIGFILILSTSIQQFHYLETSHEVKQNMFQQVYEYIPIHTV